MIFIGGSVIRFRGVDVTVLGLVGGAPGGETPRVADSSAAGAGRFFHNSVPPSKLNRLGKPPRTMCNVRPFNQLQGLGAASVLQAASFIAMRQCHFWRPCVPAVAVTCVAASLLHSQLHHHTHRCRIGCLNTPESETLSCKRLARASLASS